MDKIIRGDQFEIVNGLYAIPVRVEEDEHTITVYFINTYDCMVNKHRNDEGLIHHRTFNKACINNEEIELIRSSVDRYKNRGQ